MSLTASTCCPALEAVGEWKKAATALDAVGRNPKAGGEAEASERFARAFDQLHELGAQEGEPVSHAGAVAALELVATPEAAALDFDDLRALAALALRHLRSPRPTI